MTHTVETLLKKTFKFKIFFDYRNVKCQHFYSGVLTVLLAWTGDSLSCFIEHFFQM